MSTSTNIHDIVSVLAKTSKGHSWLQIEDRNGNTATLFMPYNQAVGMADAFDWYVLETRAPQLESETA